MPLWLWPIRSTRSNLGPRHPVPLLNVIVSYKPQTTEEARLAPCKLPVERLRPMATQTDAFVCYFKNALPTLACVYKWRIPEFDGFDPNGGSVYERNVRLKWFLHCRWHNAKTGDEKLSCAKEIIARWGGVRGNKDQTLAKYIAKIEEPDRAPATPLQGIASYSKLFAIAFPDQYAIYDARVAACLNAIQYQYQVDERQAFNYCPSRNKNIKEFTRDKRFLITSLACDGWQCIPKKDTYQTYLNLLEQCRNKLCAYELHDFEMTLFANAEKECGKAMKMAR